jgi:hypothetical protein
MANVMAPGAAAMRCADAVMCAGGGRTVLLRLSAPAVPGSDAEQLGLATPGFQDVPLAPATFHKASDVNKLLVSASVVDALMGTLAYDSADVLFETAVGVLIDDLLYEITDSYASQVMGQPYCYWLILKRPVR